MRINDYDFKEHTCKLCGMMMSKDYFLKHHDSAECLKTKFYRDERLKEVTKCSA